MKDTLYFLLSMAAAVIVGMGIGYHMGNQDGYSLYKKQIVNRIDEYPKDKQSYTAHQVEYIIFGESQE
jgi:hypothetical protein